MPYLRDLEVEFVSLVDRAAVRDPNNPTEPQRFLMTKSEVPVWKSDCGAITDPEGGTMSEAEQSAALEKAQADLAKAESERDAAVAKSDELTQRVEKLEADLAKASKPKPDNDNDADDLQKSDLPPAWRARIEKMEADQKAAVEKAEQDAKIAKEERDLRVTREFVAKAETFKGLSLDASTFGPVLKSVSEKLSKEEAEEIDRVLKAADEQIAQGDLFKAFGKSGDPERVSGDDAIVRKAEELRKADSSLSEYESMRLAARGEAGAAHLQSVR